jgi:aspartokinase/homoserine dehydrogenase 1
MNIKVLKFSGSSLENKESFENILEVILGQEVLICVVVSGSLYIQQQIESYFQYSLEQKSMDAVERPKILLSLKEQISSKITQLRLSPQAEILILRRVAFILESISTLGDKLKANPEQLGAHTLSAKIEIDSIYGFLLAEALAERGFRSTLISSAQILRLHGEGGDLVPEHERSAALAREAIHSHLKKGVTSVIFGSYGESKSGFEALAPQGSDYLATLLGSYLGASEVCIYKDDDGYRTADPRHVYEARVVPELHYREAGELGFFGGTVLHPKVVMPLLDQGIAIRVKNIFHPDKPGTKVSDASNFESFPVKAISFVEHQTMVTLEGKAMRGVPGIAAKTFSTMADHGISVSFITQTSSETSICFIVPGILGPRAKQLLDLAFHEEIRTRFMDPVRLEENLAIIAIVGLGMKGTPGIAARAFQAIAKENINISAIAQGSSELNISMVTQNHMAPKALRALHREYGLEKLRAIPSRDPQVTSLYLHGFGQIGQNLVKQLLVQKDFLGEKLKLNCPIIGLSDSSGFVLCESGFSEVVLESLLQQKSGGLSLGKMTQVSLKKDTSEIWGGPWGRKIYVDLTNSESLAEIEKAIRGGFHIVLANKKPLASPYKDYLNLFNLAEKHQVQIRYEATVGAGLPILDTLHKLASSGDHILEIEGCFSGTLGYLMTKLEEQVPFSIALKEAHAKGFTEPDPRDDLSGMDVARKALILARFMGLKLELSHVNLTPLFPDDLKKASTQEFMTQVSRLDSLFQGQMAEAHVKGNTLRYVASISKDRVSVGIKEVSKSSSLGRLRGTDNQVSVRTKRYLDNPLIVTGPGAGAEVTAAGVLNDIISIAASQERNV